MSEKPQYLYVVSYDHPQYGWGVQSVWTTKAKAIKDIKDDVELEHYDFKRDFERVSPNNSAITTYAGVGNADGTYYSITRLRLD